MRYMVFDLPAHPGPFDERLAALNQLVAGLGIAVQAVPQQKLLDRAALLALLKKTLKAGGEGWMLHRGASAWAAVSATRSGATRHPWSPPLPTATSA